MTPDNPAAEPNPADASRRRSDRFPVVVPVEVKWQEPGGVIVKEDAQAREVNAFGGLLQVKSTLRVGGDVELTNHLSAETTQARVVAVRRSREGAVLGVAVELLIPSETFWGVTFRLKKTSAELVKLEQAIKAGGMDLRVLREFRDAVDYVRKTAWVVQEWQERQLQRRDTSTVLPLLIVERIRRAIQLSNTVATDLDAHEVTHDTAGIDDLFRATEHLFQRLGGLFRDHKAQ